LTDKQICPHRNPLPRWERAYKVPAETTIKARLPDPVRMYHGRPGLDEHISRGQRRHHGRNGLPYRSGWGQAANAPKG